MGRLIPPQKGRHGGGRQRGVRWSRHRQGWEALEGGTPRELCVQRRHGESCVGVKIKSRGSRTRCKRPCASDGRQFISATTNKLRKHKRTRRLARQSFESKTAIKDTAARSTPARDARRADRERGVPAHAHLSRPTRTRSLIRNTVSLKPIEGSISRPTRRRRECEVLPPLLLATAMAKVAPGSGPTEESVTLLKEEGSMMAYAGAVSTITFFTGSAPRCYSRAARCRRRGQPLARRPPREAQRREALAPHLRPGGTAA